MYTTVVNVATWLLLVACGAKGPPVPVQRLPSAPCAVRATGLRTFQVVLPTRDIAGKRISGIESLRVYYLPLESNFPSEQGVMEAIKQGKAILELRRPDLPAPGKMVTLDLSHIGNSSGWLVVVPFRVGNMPGAPSKLLPWLDPAF